MRETPHIAYDTHSHSVFARTSQDHVVTRRVIFYSEVNRICKIFACGYLNLFLLYIIIK